MQRPTGVTILAVLAFIGAGLSVLVAIGAFLGGAVMSSMMANPRFGMLAGVGAVIVGVFLLGIAVMDVVIGFGLWKLQNWARILTIVLSVLDLIHVPFGTALGVYGLWVLPSQGSERLLRTA